MIEIKNKNNNKTEGTKLNSNFKNEFLRNGLIFGRNKNLGCNQQKVLEGNLKNNQLQLAKVYIKFKCSFWTWD